MQQAPSDLPFEAVTERLSAYADEDLDGVLIKIDWDLPQVIRSSVGRMAYNNSANNEAWSAEAHVVMLKDPAASDHLMATTCKEYLLKNWDTTWSQPVLDLLDRFKAKTTEAERSEPSLFRRILSPAIAANVGLAMSIATTPFLGPAATIWGFGFGVAGAAIATWNNNTHARIHRIPSERIPDMDVAVLDSHIPGITEAYIILSNSAVWMYFRRLSDVQAAISFVEAWDWFCKAVRRAPPSTATLSDISYVFGEEWVSSKKTLRISGHIGSTPLPEIEHSCWEKLFTSYMLVPSKLEPRSEFGKGLEVSFDLMIFLAAAEFQPIVNGGIVFIGYRTLLFPTAIHENSAQFHLLATEKGQINPYLQEYGSRIMTENTSQFTKMRCFLGWCEDARVNLGTERLTPSIKSSGADNKKRTTSLDGFATTMQAGLPSPVQALFGLQANFRVVSHRLRFPPPENYAQLLEETARETALIYDSSERRGWLVPKLSLLLHMGQAYATRCGWPKGRVPLVGPHSDAATLITHLEPLGETAVGGHGKGAFLFRHLLLGLNTNLLKTRVSVRQSGGKNLYGYELTDIITNPGRGSCMKEIRLGKQGSKAWIDIANEVDALVVCAGLGDAITAADEARTRNKQCSRVPPARDYLAATINCLKILVESRGGALEGDLQAQMLQISDESFWDLSSNPFSICNHSSSPGGCWESTEVFQRLASRKFTGLRRILGRTQPPSTSIKIPASGAVVFGNLAEEPKTSHKPLSSYQV